MFSLPARTRRLAPLLVLAGLASCRTIDRTVKALDVIDVPQTRAYNLEQLHQADHHHRHLARRVGDLQYLMRRGIGGLRPGRYLAQERAPSKIDDPSIECRATLASLGRFDADDVVISNLQVEWAVRIATLDPWRLSREQALFELEKAALRLDVGVPQGLPQDATPAPVEEVVEALTALIRAYRPTLERAEDELSTDEWDAFDGAVEQVRALTLDLESGRRALKAVGALIPPADADSRVRRALDPLALEIQRRIVSQALAAALNDPLPPVRAVAIHVAVGSGGDVVLAQALAQLGPQSSEEVIETVMRLVRHRGLPEENDELSGERYERARMQWLSVIVEFATNHPAGPVRVRAMQALAAVTDDGPDSLREEDWQRWWTAYRAEAAGPSPNPDAGPTS